MPEDFHEFIEISFANHANGKGNVPTEQITYVATYNKATAIFLKMHTIYLDTVH